MDAARMILSSYGQRPFFQCVALKERALDPGDKADYFRQNPEFRSTFPVIS